MMAGVDRIYQDVLVAGGASGIPDLLEKVSGNSKFRDYFYTRMGPTEASLTY